MIVVSVDHSISVNTEHPGTGDSVELVDADGSGGRINVDDLRLAVEGAQTSLVVVLQRRVRFVTGEVSR